MAIMDAKLFEMAKQGNLETLENYAKILQLPVTPNGNTILHIHLTSPSERSADFVKQAIDLFPKLLWETNIFGETPLHIAARYGHFDAAKVLIEQSKIDIESGGDNVRAARDMLRMYNENKDTALHEAARNNHIRLVKLLTKEDPNFKYIGNNCHETPLYLAAAKGYLYVVKEILANSKSVSYGGPNGIVLEILRRQKQLAIKADDDGWTPLHYAAYGNNKRLGAYLIVQRLLESDRSAAYMVDNERKRAALHIAACRGNIRIMEKIISECPDCCELIDSKGWNVLHYAVISKNDEALRVILRNSSLFYLIHGKDVEGNTPLHLLAASRPYLPSFVYDGEDDLNSFYKLNIGSREDLIAQLPNQQEKLLEEMEDLGNGPLGKICINRKGSWEVQDLRSGPKGAKVLAEFEKSKDSFLVVSGLVATVTFTAAFTLPGGFKSDQNDPHQGTAILSKTAAFEAFVVTDTIAMVLSTASVFIHFIMMLVGYQEKYWWLIRSALLFIMFAMGAMVVAFATGLYAVLSPSLGLAVATCFITLTFFIYVFYMLRRLYWRHLEKDFLEALMTFSKLWAKFRLTKSYY